VSIILDAVVARVAGMQVCAKDMGHLADILVDKAEFHPQFASVYAKAASRLNEAFDEFDDRFNDSLMRRQSDFEDACRQLTETQQNDVAFCFRFFNNFEALQLLQP
jgi:hypothetical protein